MALKQMSDLSSPPPHSFGKRPFSVRIRKLYQLFLNQGISAVLHAVLSRVADRLNADNNENPATNGEYAMLRAFLKPDMVLADVGANLGDWTNYALGLQPSLRIFSFEPEPYLYAHLAQRFAGDDRVTTINAALADCSGETNLHIFSDWGGSNSLYRRNCATVGQVLRKEPVVVISGADFMAEYDIKHIDFLKIDVEGAELRVLQGFSRAFIQRQIGICQLEYGNTYLDAGVYLKDVFAFAENVQYLMAKVIPKGMQPIRSFDQALETFKYANFLLLRDSTLLQ